MDDALGTQPQGDRLSRLSQASLRINKSLDIDTIPQAVMSSAQSLTDATDLERLWLASRQEVFFDVRTGGRRPSARQVIRDRVWLVMRQARMSRPYQVV